MDSVKIKIDQLREELNRHNYNYYVLNTPEISDYNFDMKMKELERLESSYPQFDDPYSPTHRVGSDISKGFTQWIHKRPLLSLGNTYSMEEVDDFVRRVKDGLMGEQVQIVGELKYDGTSISLSYEHGRLVRAVTRGDGTQGDVVTDNIVTIKSIPLQLQGEGWPDEFEIRGEIVLPWKEFDRLNAEREFNEEPLFANPRNAASGTLKLQNSSEVARRGLDAVFYYLLGDNLPADNHYDNMMAARKWGFKVAPVMTLMTSTKEVGDFISYWDIKRKELPVATDGLVFKVNDLRQQLNLGYTAKSPRWATAYKFQAERALTELKFVSFEVGRMGIVTPVANLEPVLLSGTIVKRASLHNEDIIKQLDIHDGDMLYVEKGGEIIPKITGVELSRRKFGSETVKFVKDCPVCGTPLVRIEGEAAWMCPNKTGCAPQICGRIEHFVGRRMMNIDGIGEEMAAILYENGWVSDPSDLYELERYRAEMLKLQGMGPRTIDRMLYALSIPYLGETSSKKVAKALRNIDAVMNADNETLCSIDDIGPRIAQSIREYFSIPSNRNMVGRLQSFGLQMALPDNTAASGSEVLAGKSIVVSGTFNKRSRDEYKEMIELNGGKNVGSVSKKTDFILAGENMGPSKLDKAKSLGIPLVDEDSFLKMISGQN